MKSFLCRQLYALCTLSGQAYSHATFNLQLIHFQYISANRPWHTAYNTSCDRIQKHQLSMHHNRISTVTSLSCWHHDWLCNNKMWNNCVSKALNVSERVDFLQQHDIAWNVDENHEKNQFLSISPCCLLARQLFWTQLISTNKSFNYIFRISPRLSDTFSQFDTNFYKTRAKYMQTVSSKYVLYSFLIRCQRKKQLFSRVHLRDGKCSTTVITYLLITESAVILKTDLMEILFDRKCLNEPQPMFRII